MRNGFVGSLAWLLLGVGVVVAQPAPPDVGLFGGESCVGGEGWTPSGHLSASAEFLWWWIKDSRPLPPLLIGSNLINAEEDDDDFTNSLIRGDGLNYPSQFGGRFTAAYWFDEHKTFGLGGSYFFLAEEAVDYRSPGSRVLGRSFFNLNTNREDAFLVAFPNLASGTLIGSSDTKLWGGEATAWHNLIAESITEPFLRLDALAGFRYLELDEGLSIGSVTSFQNDVSAFPQFGPLAGSVIQASDSFRTRNQFYGGQVGLVARLFGECAYLELGTKLAIGQAHQEVLVNGSQTVTLPGGATATSPGGVLALASNSGRVSRDKLAFIPEETVTLCVPVSKHLTLRAGYSFLYWHQVVRPGDQVDRNVDVGQLANFPGPGTDSGLGRPVVPFTQSSFWVQGVNFGVEYCW